MRILYHHRTQGHGAEGVHITEIVKGFQRLGHEVVLCSPPGVDPMKTAGTYLYGSKKSAIGRVWKWISKHLPQILFEGLEISYNFFQRAKLERTLKEGKFDFIYERYAFFLWVTASLSRKHGLPLVLEVNEVSNIKRARPLLLGRLARRIERKVFAQASHIVTVSSYLKQRIADLGIDPAKVTVMPNGVDQTAFSPRDGSKVRARLGVDGETVIGFVGWIDPWDNLPGLLEVFAELVRREPRLRLMLVGDVAGKGVEPDYVAKLVRKLGLEKQVIHLKRVPRPEMPDHIAAMDICVIPDSNVFGSPVVLFEFMGMRKAVVAPSVLPVTDVVEHGRNGLVFQAHDKAGMRDRLWDAVKDPALRERLADNARECVEREHNWGRNSEKVIELVRGGKR